MSIIQNWPRLSRTRLNILMSNQGNLPTAQTSNLRNFTRQADHTANTIGPESSVHILALRTDTDHHKHMTALRKQYFPATLNKLEAHVALFRALPGSQLSAIDSDMEEIGQSLKPFRIRTTKAFALGHGVAMHVHAPEVTELFNRLKHRWEGLLSKQDQSFKAHYTLQNKVEKAVAEKILQEVRETFRGSEGIVTGLSCFKYDKSFWEHEKDYTFGKSESQVGDS